MYTIDVIPLSQSIPKDTLSYYSLKELQPGMVVSVPVRKKNQQALVVRARNVREEKSSIKSQGFTLKKITEVIGYTAIPPEFIQALALGRRHFCTPIGVLLASCVAENLREVLVETRRTKRHLSKTKKESSDGMQTEKLVLQRDRKERLGFYRTFVRQEFAENRSALILFPTIYDTETMYEEIHRGIKDRVVVLHSDVSPAELKRRVAYIMNTESALVILATPSFMAVPRGDIKTIIVEEEHASGYRRDFHPKIDFRTLSELYAETLGATHMRADTFVQTDTLWRIERGDYHPHQPLSFRVDAGSHIAVITTEKHDKEASSEIPEKKKRDRVLTEKLVELLTQRLSHESKVVCIAPRKGLAPLTLCRDCGTTLSCDTCHLPLVLHNKVDNGRVYLCHYCSKRTPVIDACPTCLSWRLGFIGAGIDRIAEELGELFPDTTIRIMSKDTASTHKKAMRIVDAFNEDKKAILVGTQLAIPYIPTGIKTGILVSIDTLFGLPRYTIEEEIFHLVMRCADRVEDTLVIQTRNSDSNVMKTVTSRRFRDLYNTTLKERKEFHYPPFRTLIRVSVPVTTTNKSDRQKILEGYFGDHDPDMYVGPNRRKDTQTLYLLMNLSYEDWQDNITNPASPLVERLASLPRPFEVEINPPSLL